MRLAVGMCLAVFALGSSQAHACITTRTFDIAVLANAPSLARVEVEAYEARNIERSDAQQKLLLDLGLSADQEVPKYAVVELKVLEMLRGVKLPGRVTASWRHSTFSMGPSWTGPKEILVGLEPGDTLTDHRFSIVQQACAPLTYLNDTAENRDIVLGR